MSIASSHEEYLQHLLELKKRCEVKIGLLRKAAPQYLNSEKEPGLLGSNYKNAQSGREAMKDMAAKDSTVFEAAPRWHRKRTAVESLEESAVLMDDDDEIAPELKDQSQERTDIETECSQNQERTKQRKQKKESDAPKYYCRVLDFRGHDRSEDGFLVEEIKRLASGLDGIEITRCTNRDQSMVAHDLAKPI